MNADTALLATVQQINHVIGQLTPEDYRFALPEFEGNSLGQHFRHILEFFQCLEQGVTSGTVDYAARQRNPVYEQRPEISAAAFEAFSHALPRFDLAQPVQVRAEFGSDLRPCYESTVGRELLFVYDHAIHHLAIIKIGLICHFPKLHADKDLGVSPSTVKARAKMEN
ncbi:MAG: DinB family protein [Saprospiraceae bacterium]|nr:DinB family protein [Saprospiraceae bacterium]